jgi:hypothetical protein
MGRMYGALKTELADGRLFTNRNSITMQSERRLVGDSKRHRVAHVLPGWHEGRRVLCLQQRGQSRVQSKEENEPRASATKALRAEAVLVLSIILTLTLTYIYPPSR